MDVFEGTLTLDDGEEVPIELLVDDETLELRTAGHLVGAWPVKYCRVSRSGRGAVLLSIDGEKAVFQPRDLARFGTVAAQRFRASSLADRISVVRDIPSSDGVEPSGGQSESMLRRLELPWLRRWLVPALATFVLLVGAMLAWSWLERAQIPGFVGTTVSIPVAATPAPPLFDQTTEEFSTEWNLAATAFGVPLQIRDPLVPGRFESQLSSHVTLQGRTAEDDTISSVILVIDPTGDAAEDEVALSALGVAIRVANPELDRDGRAAVLERMGLSVDDPDLKDADGAVEVGRTSYSLSYIDEFGSLLFAINEMGD